jgi:hypothetical protein
MIDRLDDRQFRVAILVVASMLVVVIVNLRFCYQPALPAKPPRPQVTSQKLQHIAAATHASVEVYAGYLDRDSTSYGLARPVAVADMRKALVHRVDDGEHLLDPRSKDRARVEAAGLRLATTARRVPGAQQTQLVLSITNTTDRELAYRVVTRPSLGELCHSKASLTHNAMVVAPRATEERTECVYRNRSTLLVTRVETLELNPLSASYVAKLPPAAAGIDTRIAKDHRAPFGQLCSVAMPAAVRSALESGATTWRDVVDFFARHRCETYRFPSDYKAFERDGERRLPAGVD